MSDDLLTQKLLSGIIETEKEKRVWLTPKSLVRTTKEVAADAKNRFALGNEPFSIYRNRTLDLSLWLTMTCMFLAPVLYYGITKEVKINSQIVFGIIFYFILLAFFVFAGYKNLTTRSWVSPIVLTINDLTIDDEVIPWSEIYETYYVYRFSGRVRRSFFVVGFTNGFIQYFDIRNQLGFKYSERDFSRFVEHYKQFTSHNRCLLP